LHEHDSVMGCAATGFGKTIVSGAAVRAAHNKQRRVIFTVHRENLLAQTSQTFADFGVPHGFIAPGYPYHSGTLVHIASIATLQRRLDRIEAPDLLMIDEAHMAMAKGWKLVADYCRAKGGKTWGNSATPIRLDGQPLSPLFDYMVEGPPVRWLMDQGHLSDYEYYAPDIPDLSQLKKRLGDYDQGQAADVMDRPKLIGSVVKHYKQLARGKRAILFAMNVKHSEHMAAEFNRAGIPAAHIDGDTLDGDRKRILNDFADGKIMVLCNVELVTTGFDLSAQVKRDVPVECVILCRPTMSLALFLQMVGRALRRKPYPAIILDHAGNSMRHGFPDDPHEWSLEGNEKGEGGASEGPPPPITCEGCFRQIRRPAPPQCPYCKREFHKPTKPIEEGEGELILQTADIKAALRAKRIAEDREAKTLHELVALGAARGYASPQGWAFKKWSNSKHRSR